MKINATRHLYWLIGSLFVFLLFYYSLFTFVIRFLSNTEASIVLLFLSITWLVGGLMVFVMLKKQYSPVDFTKGLLAMIVVQFLILLLSFVLVAFVIKTNKAAMCYHLCFGFLPMMVVQTTHLSRMANKKTPP
jgi:hypothetical protein